MGRDILSALNGLENLPFDREAPCPACGIQLVIVGLCRESHPAAATEATDATDATEHLHVCCPGCGWGAHMRTAAQSGPRWPADVPRTLHGFIVDGRLVSIPARAGRRREALRHIASESFEAGRTYPEPEVDGLLARWHPDVASLRRYLVDEGFMRRAAGIYELLPAEAWPDS